MRTSWFLLIFALIFNNCLAQDEDPNVVFEKRLLQWIEAANAVEDNQNQTNIAQLDDAFRDLRTFARQYPDSKYADDADLIRYKSTEVSSDKWDEFLTKYSSGKSEDFTKEQLGKLKGNLVSLAYECSVPYELIPIYTQGQVCWLSENFVEAEKRFSEFLQKIELHYPELKNLSPDPYIKLLMVYKQLNKRKEYDKIKEKVFILFPAKREFAENLWP
jgi:hypothetical protein